MNPRASSQSTLNPRNASSRICHISTDVNPSFVIPRVVLSAGGPLRLLQVLKVLVEIPGMHLLASWLLLPRLVLCQTQKLLLLPTQHTPTVMEDTRTKNAMVRSCVEKR
uniref:Uncharacterized protein n=1 Tax=Cacopsylla melanoneura TaxID=428564 RepID=A0A8D8LEX2_9HEMI